MAWYSTGTTFSDFAFSWLLCIFSLAIVKNYATIEYSKYMSFEWSAARCMAEYLQIQISQKKSAINTEIKVIAATT